MLRGLCAIALLAIASCIEQPLDLGRSSLAAARRSSFTAADVAAAEKTCSAPRGQSERYTTPDELRTLLVGSWFRCSGPSYIASMQFTEDGRVYLLLPDGNGGLVPGSDQDSVATYRITSGNEMDLVVDMTRSNSGGSSTRVTFEASPRRMVHDYSVERAVFVPLE